LSEFRDDDNNILALQLEISGSTILLVSIYGPNTNDFTFFRNMEKILKDNKNIPVICAGDWNATYCTDSSTCNIDVINMCNPPSHIRSGWISDICDKFNLSDPFRTIHYNSRDFTYVPRDGGKNRSRIDFFLVSDMLLRICNKCTISPSLNTSLFDHKSITLTFNVSNKPKQHYINPIIFKHPRFEAVVTAAVLETYLQHAVEGQRDIDVAEGLLHVGRLINKISVCNEIEFNMNFDMTY
jgi:hypothetical protein